ncbi:MAG: L-2-hydroxyglutarate oxidase [Chryseolinea sp.]
MEYDVIIVGGGAVGLATALQLQKQNPKFKLVVIEKDNVVANHQTGNNSNVIHSGVYYKPGSLKAKNCIGGYDMLLDFIRKHEIPHNLCGKVIVATEEKELPLLKTILERGNQNGLKNLKMLTGDQVREHEPHVAGIAGIHVPQTGIVDYRVVAEKYAEVFQKQGGTLKLGEKVVDIQLGSGNAVVVTQKSTYSGKLVVNCGGLYADKLAKLTRNDVNFKIIPFRGEYYKLKKEKEYLCKTLIYPVPDPNFPFLGVHFTTMVGGGVECGPNAVLAFKREGYKKSDFNLSELAETLAWPGFRKVVSKYWRTGLGEIHRSYSKPAFTKALQKLMPEIREEDLIEGGAGVRAQACDRTGGLLDDFLILEDKQVINVCNAPSPAATSSLAIGQTVADWAAKRF